MRIAICAKTCEFAGAALLAAALKEFNSGKVTLSYHMKVVYDFRKWFPEAVRLSQNPERCINDLLLADWVLVTGAPAVQCLLERLPVHPAWVKMGLPSVYDILRKKRGVACFATGGQWHMEGEEAREYWRGVYSKIGSVFFTMPNLVPLVDLDPLVPYYQPITPVEVEKSKHILLSHSPGAKLGEDSKGTSQIVDGFRRICEKHPGTAYEILTGMSNKECIKARARSHIFVDQLPVFVPLYKEVGVGGIGKSGLEAMTCGCATITSAMSLPSDPFFPSPPVLIAITSEELFETIESLIVNPESLKRVQREQKLWARKYVSPKFVAKHVISTLRKYSV